MKLSNALRLIAQRVRKPSIAKTFSDIYRSGIWGGGGDNGLSSGIGSTGRYVDNYRALLEPQLRKYHVQSVADLGCGNFNTGRVVATLVPRYIGIDVVQDVIDTNNRLYSTKDVQFTSGDLTIDTLPRADAAIVRQVLQHLSNAEIQAALANICRTYSLAFITEHIYIGPDCEPNLDMGHGAGTRAPQKSGVYIDKEPFNLPAAEIGDIEHTENEVLRTWVIGADAFK